MKYTVYFEIFGKKMKTTTEALSPTAAKEQVRNKIIFHKIEPENDIWDYLNKITQY